MTKIIRKDDDPLPWDGNNNYAPRARCTHKGSIWMAADSGIYNAQLEPGGFGGQFYWTNVGVA